MYSAAIVGLFASGINQWDNEYPSPEIIKMDICNKQMTIGIVDSKIVVAFTLNQECDEQYLNGDWKNDTSFLVIHRLCVTPDLQKTGIAKHTMQYIEYLCKADFIKSIRLDTFIENRISTSMYLKIGYKVVGTADWRKGKFQLMEKEI